MKTFSSFPQPGAQPMLQPGLWANFRCYLLDRRLRRRLHERLTYDCPPGPLSEGYAPLGVCIIGHGRRLHRLADTYLRTRRYAQLVAELRQAGWILQGETGSCLRGLEGENGIMSELELSLRVAGPDNDAGSPPNSLGSGLALPAPPWRQTMLTASTRPSLEARAPEQLPTLSPLPLLTNRRKTVEA